MDISKEVLTSLFDKGVTRKEVAVHLGIKAKKLKQLIREYGLIGYKVVNKRKIKISETDTEKIKKLRIKGESFDSISRAIGVCRHTLSRKVKELDIDKPRISYKTCSVCGGKASNYAKTCLKCRWIGKKSTQRLKKELLNDRNYRCGGCGIQTYNNAPITLELHHIDGDSGNDNLENLQLLCPNCHSQMWDYRASMNKASTRRYKRYFSDRIQQ